MSWESEFLRRLAKDPAGPTILAIALALIALPIVAVSLQAYDISQSTDGNQGLIALTAPGRWTAATGSVLAAAIVAGTVGGFVRTRILHAEVFTFCLAWIVGIAAVPIGPFLFHQSVGFERVCADACNVSIRATDPTAGLSEAILFPLGPFVEGASFVALLVGFSIWWAILRHFAPLKELVSVPPVSWVSVPPVSSAASTSAPMPGAARWPALTLPPRAADFLHALANHPVGPTALAVALAIVALPIVALTLQLYQPSAVSDLHIYPLPPLDAARWTAAAGGVTISALVAGTVGRWWRMRQDHFGLVTFIVAWLTAVVATPLVPGLLGQRVGLESICSSGSCSVLTRTGDPGLGLGLLLASPLGPMSEPVSFLVLLVGVWLWYRVMARFGPPVPPRPKGPIWVQYEPQMAPGTPAATQEDQGGQATGC